MTHSLSFPPNILSLTCYGPRGQNADCAPPTSQECSLVPSGPGRGPEATGAETLPPLLSHCLVFPDFTLHPESLPGKRSRSLKSQITSLPDITVRLTPRNIPGPAPCDHTSPSLPGLLSTPSAVATLPPWAPSGAGLTHSSRGLACSHWELK